MSPPSTTGSAPVAGEAQWAGAGHPALRPALLLCARRRDQVLAHGARDEDGVDDEPLAPVRGGADVWVAGSVEAEPLGVRGRKVHAYRRTGGRARGRLLKPVGLGGRVGLDPLKRPGPSIRLQRGLFWSAVGARLSQIAVTRWLFAPNK